MRRLRMAHGSVEACAVFSGTAALAYVRQNQWIEFSQEYRFTLHPPATTLLADIV